MTEDLKILVYGYGNPGRQDDGLAATLVEKLEIWAKREGLYHVSFDVNYQLNIEDSERISAYDLVVFVDASTESIEDVQFTVVSGGNEVVYTTHAASPGFVFEMCKNLFGKEPLAFLLHIKGYRWELEEGLSEGAAKNLHKAFMMMQKGLKNPALFNEWAVKSLING